MEKCFSYYFCIWFICLATVSAKMDIGRDNTNSSSGFNPKEKIFYLSKINGTVDDNCGLDINHACSNLARVIDRFTKFDLTHTNVIIRVDAGLTEVQTYNLKNYSISLSNIRCLKLEPLPSSTRRPKFKSEGSNLIPLFRFGSQPCLEINNVDFDGLLMVGFTETRLPVTGNIVISNSQWHVNARTDEISFIDGGSAENNPNISVSLTDVVLESDNQRPVFLVKQNDLNDKTKWNIEITRTMFSAVGFNLKFNKGKVIATNCTLDASVNDYYTVTLSNFDELQISGLRLNSEFVSPVGYWGVIKVDNINKVEINQTDFFQIGDKVDGRQVIHVTDVDDMSITDCQFHNLFESAGHVVLISIRDTLTISDCQFHDVTLSSRNVSLIYLEKITANVSIIDSNFENVHSATIYCSDCKHLDLYNVTFVKCFRPIVLLQFTTLNIDRCYFNKNKADIGGGINIAGPGHVNITSSHFIKNFAVQAGAINSQDADVDIKDSSFIENSGSTSGTFRFTGTLDKSKNLIKLTNLFIQSPKKKSPDQSLPIFSTVMESNGPSLRTNNVTIDILETVESIDLFVTHLDPSSSLIFRCPVNTRVKSAESLFWSCKSCFKDTYTMQYGQMTMNETGKHELPFKCKTCPYGGECTGQAKMASRINFWGYTNSKGNVEFIQCLPGHCCQDNAPGHSCSGINSCTNNWEGDVCSKCPKNHYVSFFGQKCIPDERCNSRDVGGFWSLFAIFTVIVFLVVAYYQEIVRKIGKIIRKIGKLICKCCNRNVEEQNLASGQVENHNEVEENEDSTTKIALVFYFIKILLNFYQIENLINIESPKVLKGSNEETDCTYWIRQIISSIFNLELSFQSSFEPYCPTHGMSDPLKHFIKKIATIISLSVFAGVLLILCSAKNWFHRRRNQAADGYQAIPPDENEEDDKLTFDMRCKVFLVRIFLLGYTNMATFVMIMCNCVAIGDRMILQVGGGDCHSLVTHFFRVVFLLWVVAFPWNVRFTTGLLQKKVITVNRFMVLFYLPPLSMVYFLYRWYKGGEDREINPLEPKAKHMLSTFEASFRNHQLTNKDTGDVVKLDKILLWDYCVLARRGILAFLCVILQNYIPRLCCVAFVLFVMMVLHTHKKPYKEEILNWTETCSFLSLSVLALINLVWAFFYVYSLEQQPPVDTLVKVLKISQFLVTMFPIIFFCAYLMKGKFLSFLRRLCCTNKL